MTLLELLQISSGVSPAFLMWVAMEVRWMRSDMRNHEKRMDSLENVVFKKGGLKHA